MLQLESSSSLTSESSMPDCGDSKSPLSMKKLKEKAMFNRSSSLEVSSRRDSEDSNDSMRKPASLNEIQDLYAALHDLVKTNVTTTPIPERHHRVVSPSASNSSTQSSPRANNSPQLSLANERTGINNRRKKSREELKHDTPMKTRRGMSIGTIEIVSNLLKKSPFPTRKLSSEPDEYDPKTGQKEKVPRKTARSRSEVNCKIPKNTLEKENKKWKLNIFKRMRSKSEATSSSTDDEYEDCSSDGDESMISEKSSVLGEDVECNGNDKNFITDSIRDIDQLVAALNLECSNEMLTIAEKETSNYIINPATELDKLDNWYEKAAAEAVLYHSRQDLLETDRSCDIRENKYNRRKSASAGGLRRPSTIKRGTSLGQKDKRRSKVSVHPELPENAPLVRGQAKSTPNLREHLNNQESTTNTSSTAKEITKMDIFTENNLKNNGTNDLKTHVRKVSLEDASTRLPKSPLFYLPTENTISETTNPSDIAKMDISLSLQYENGKQPSPRTIERMKKYKSLDIYHKKNNFEIEEENKSKLKNDFFDKTFFQDSKSLWSSTKDKRPDNIRNSLHLDTGIQTDSNDNYYNLDVPDDARPRNSSLQKEVMSILDDYIKENENKTKNTKYVVT